MSSYPKIIVVETSAFGRWVRKERARRQVDALSRRLAANPQLGHVIPGTGGLRKIRMARPGQDKRGGYRVIYAILIDSRYLVLLAGYDKSKQLDLSADQRNVLMALARKMEEYLRSTLPRPEGDDYE